jgi:hypothetical protein
MSEREDAGLSPEPPVEWPPSPHDPCERTLVGESHGWQVRVFPQGEPKHAYFAARGFLHVQLWEPTRGVSLLTPSRLTEDRFEVFPVRSWKCRPPDYDAVREVVLEAHGVGVPPWPVVRALERWFVRRFEVEAERAGSAQDGQDP